VGSIALAVVALLVAVFVLIGNGSPSKKSGSRPTTTTTRPKATTTTQAGKPGIGLQSVVWTDTNPSAGLVVNPKPGGSAGPRTLDTEIWYPAIGGSAASPTVGARPDYHGGPFPVVVFAHGFDTLPATYTSLLASLVHSGFVVVAPLFPDENANEINSLGDATFAESEIAESDIVNEPYDIAYVVGQVESGARGSASSHAAWLKGLVEPGKVALVGHSDGAQATAALVYSANYASTYGAMGSRPFGVVILSGSELSDAGKYAAPADPPPMLFVQSAADTCNLPQDAGTLFHDAGGGFFLKLASAHHFSPYVGIGPAAPVVEEVAAAFLKAAQAGTPSASSFSSVTLSPSIATLYPPSAKPSLIALPQPTQAERIVDCAVPTTTG
jgi:dienelactone hydrolase